MWDFENEYTPFRHGAHVPLSIKLGRSRRRSETRQTEQTRGIQRCDAKQSATAGSDDHPAKPDVKQVYRWDRTQNQLIQRPLRVGSKRDPPLTAQADDLHNGTATIGKGRRRAAVYWPCYVLNGFAIFYDQIPITNESSAGLPPRAHPSHHPADYSAHASIDYPYQDAAFAAAFSTFFRHRLHLGFNPHAHAAKKSRHRTV